MERQLPKPSHRASDVRQLFTADEDVAESPSAVAPLAGLAQFASEHATEPAGTDPAGAIPQDADPEPTRGHPPAARHEEPRPTSAPEDPLARALVCYEVALFSGDADARQHGVALLDRVLGSEPDREDARLLRQRFETLGKMLDASPRNDPLARPAPARPVATRTDDALPVALSAPVFTSSAPDAGSTKWAIPVVGLVIAGLVLVGALTPWGGRATVASDGRAPVAAAGVPTRAAPATDDSESGERASESSATPTGAIPASTRTAADAPIGDPRVLREVVLVEEHDQLPFAGTAIPELARVKLDELASQALSRPAGFVVEVDGHTDALGPAEYNRQLGLARAESVRTYLHERHQLPLDRITVASYGEERPAASNDTSQGQARNRRVTVRLLQASPDGTAGAGP